MWQIAANRKVAMGSVFRVSPVAIFGFVCVAFVILYVGKYVLFRSVSVRVTKFNTEDLQKNAKSVSLKSLLEVSIHLAEKGGSILKKIREKNDLNVCKIYQF